jgi:hypothetical protein
MNKRVVIGSLALGVSISTGLSLCMHLSPAGAQSLKPAPTPQTVTPSAHEKVWLPIHQEHGRITAVGSYRLPEAILIPHWLGLIPTALVHVPDQQSGGFIGVELFFQTAQEQAVYEWAKGFPVIVSRSGGFRWVHTWRHFSGKDPRGVMEKSTLSQLPRSAPEHWIFAGTTNRKVTPILSFSWSGDPRISSTVLRQAIKDKRIIPSDAGVYGATSPVKDEPRLVELGFDYFGKPSKITRNITVTRTAR